MAIQFVAGMGHTLQNQLVFVPQVVGFESPIGFRGIIWIPVQGVNCPVRQPDSG